MLIQNILIACVVALVFAALGYAIARARLLSTSYVFKWLYAVDQSNAISEVGLFGNQNSVARPKT